MAVHARSALQRPSGRKAGQTYDTLVAATRKEIAEEGKFSAESVAARSGVAPATFYAYFASKDDALAAAFDAVLDELNSRAGAELSIERLLDAGLRSLVRDLARAAIAVFHENAMVFRLALTRLPESSTIRGVYRARQTEGLRILRRFVELGAKAGCIRRDRHDAVVTALLVTLQGYNNPMLLTARPPARVVDELASMAEHLLAVSRRRDTRTRHFVPPG